MPKVCIIFDLDGTLINSDQFDGRLYADAVREALGNVTIRSRWEDYEHVALFDRLGAGDGEWDRRASEQLGWGFIGIGAQLRGRCRHWYPDFTPVQLLQSLESGVA